MDPNTLLTIKYRNTMMLLHSVKLIGDYLPSGEGQEDVSQIVSKKVSKGLEFQVVALSGVGHMPARGEDEQEVAREFYVAATWAPQRLVIGVGVGVG